MSVAPSRTTRNPRGQKGAERRLGRAALLAERLHDFADVLLSVEEASRDAVADFERMPAGRSAGLAIRPLNVAVASSRIFSHAA